ncbi:MAG: chemotaxis protein CheW [Pseudomonadota bacterium]
MSDSSQIEQFLNYMPTVQKCQDDLSELNFIWRHIESTTKMICPFEAKTILPIMNYTRKGFNSLEEKLINNLISENIAKSVQEIKFKAQVIIDIVVRNLFERTADVGFLATDGSIIDFINSKGDNISDILDRLKEYRDKYTVYEDIIILDLEGNVLINLDENNKISFSKDPLIKQTIESDFYVETFRSTDLRPMLDRSLIYSKKIIDPFSKKNIGVLCLCFVFENEMKGVFSGLGQKEDRSIMLMLDANGFAIATNDPYCVPLGRQVPLALEGDYEIIYYGGREYFAKTCSANNYQGYDGPGWYGHIMIPYEYTFKHKAHPIFLSLGENVYTDVMKQTKNFCPTLHYVIESANEINESLRRVVWNGQAMSSTEKGDFLRLKSILEEISYTGDKTRSTFSNSIQDLFQTIISSGLQYIKFISRLAIDIMDRNLYERANDCRWWVLDLDIRNILSKSIISEEDLNKVNNALSIINSLYTVYTRIFIFDVSGKIIASSNLNGDNLEVIDRVPEGDWIRRTLALKTNQQYVVSSFESTYLYNKKPTYIYSAAIRHVEDCSRIVGGVGIVFDGEKEFLAMLEGTLPNYKGAFSVFIEKNGKVISSTRKDILPLTDFNPDPSIFSIANGESGNNIIIYENQYYMVGYTSSFGYREYKNSDSYLNDVISLVMVPIGEVSTDFLQSERQCWNGWRSQPKTQDTKEIATFFIDDIIFGIQVDDVIEAIELSVMASTTEYYPLVLGMVIFKNNTDGSETVIPVIDVKYLFYGRPSAQEKMKEIIVAKYKDHKIGLLVDQLNEVLTFDKVMMRQMSDSIINQHGLIKEVIKTDNHSKMIQVIDIESIYKRIVDKQIVADINVVE